LDATGDASEVGKATQKDAEAGKATFVGILGLDQARREAQKLASSASRWLDRFDSRADGLRAAAEFVVARKT
jgi:farnesyl diphosphate synthase